MGRLSTVHHYSASKATVGKSPGSEGSFQEMSVCLRQSSNVPGKLQLPDLKRAVSGVVANSAHSFEGR